VIAAAALCIFFVDRPFALWVAERAHRTSVYAAGMFTLQLLDVLSAAGAVFLAIAWVSGRWYRAPEALRRAVVAGIAATVAVLAALILKLAVGRSDVYPSFLENHIYEVRPFAGGNFRAFPSGTMAAAVAFAAGAGLTRRGDRVLAAVIILVIVETLVVTNSHWLSDLIGGAYLGALAGGAVRRRMRAQ